MAAKNIIKAIDIAGVNAAALILGVYTPFYLMGLPQACSFIRFNNASNTDVVISFDGVTDHEFILARAFLDLPAQLLRQPSSEVAKFAKGSMISVRGAPGIGNIYLSGYYIPE